MEELVASLIRQGYLESPKVIEAMKNVPRHHFTGDRSAKSALMDSPQPIGCGQTISAPHMVAMMVEKLDPEKGDNVLEVGGGSGYHAAVIAQIVGPEGKVTSVEYVPELVARGRKNLEKAGIRNVELVQGDGGQGYPSNAPYDGITVAAACPDVPQPLKEQLAVGGRLVLPVGSQYMQELFVITKKEEGNFQTNSYGGCVFVPLRGKYGFR